MYFVDDERLLSEASSLRQKFNAQTPFRFIVVDRFLKSVAAEELLSNYPETDSNGWDSTTYIHQKNKYQKSNFDKDSVYQQVFNELNSPELISIIEQITGIKKLTGDSKLFGGGLHQSLKGAFLNVHVDFNKHPESGYYRRLNLLIYLNKDWKKEYEGFVEFWDMEKKVLLAKISPDFNRCVIFETNEISYHGHPAPLDTPPGVTRKSLAVYYYTKQAPPGLEGVKEHNTVFKSTEGLAGRWKIFLSALKAIKERVLK